MKVTGPAHEANPSYIFVSDERAPNFFLGAPFLGVQIFTE
jgi:hypothetical protein